MRLFRFCLCLMLLTSCVSLPAWNKEPVKYNHFTVTKPEATLMVFVYPNQRELKKMWHNLGKKEPWGFGHSLYSGLQETPPYLSIGGSHPLFKEPNPLLAFYSEPTNSIHHVNGDGRFACNHEFANAKKSKKWDNSNITIEEVCKNF